MRSHRSDESPRRRGPRTPLTVAVIAAMVAAVLLAGLHFLVGPSTAETGGSASPAVSAPDGSGTGEPGLSGESKAVYSYQKAVRESVWVGTGLDSDGGGKEDRVAVDIVRPGEPAAKGRKIPVVMEASPYYSCCGRGNENWSPSGRGPTTGERHGAATPASMTPRGQ